MAVYTKLANNDIEGLLENYMIGDLISYSEIPEGILNTNYLIESTSGRYVLRLLEGEREIHEELKELNMLSFLSENKVPCPIALSTKDSSNYLMIQEKIASLFTFIEGEKVVEITDDSIMEIGIKLGRMHKLLANKEIERKGRRIDMQYFYNLIRESDLKSILGSDYDLLMSLYTRASAIDYSIVPQGIIHNDIFPDNVFIKDNEITGIIDFNDSLRGPLIFDLAIVINFWIRDKVKSEERRIYLEKLFIDHYESERRLEDSERLLLKEALLRVLLTFIFLRVNKFHIEENTGANMEFKDYRGILPLLKFLKGEIDEIY